MNKTVAWVIVALLVIGAGFLFFLRPAPMSPATVSDEQTPATSTVSQTQNSTTTQPSISVGTPTAKTITLMTSFDTSSFVSTSKYPTITGTANIPEVGIIINNSKDVGVVGTSEIPVINGRWSYSCSVALAPGNYSLILFVGNRVTTTAQLTVR